MAGHSALNYLYALAEGDMAFVHEILDLMAKNIPDDIAGIEKAMKGNDLQEIRRSAHHMKSSIQYSNDITLSELLSAIETKTGSASALAEIQALLPQLKELSGNLLKLIEAEKKKIG